MCMVQGLRDSNSRGSHWFSLITMEQKKTKKKHPRHGSQCVIGYPTNRNQAQYLQENAISVFGTRLYKSLPKYLRDIESVTTEKFKLEVDKFPGLIP